MRMCDCALARPLCARAILPAACAILSAPAFASKGEDLKNRISGHYVRLASGGEEDFPRGGMPTLRQRPQRCVADHKLIKMPCLEEPSDGWPKHRSWTWTEIYYTRTQTPIKGRNPWYHVRLSDCDPYTIESKTFTLASAAGTCVVDFKSSTATGQCDADAHPRANTPHPPRIDPSHVYIRGPQPESGGPRCRMYTTTNYSTKELCTANPGSGFPIPGASSHTALPGLVLQWTQKGIDSKADIVKLHNEFREEVFSIPEGLRHVSIDLDGRMRKEDSE